MSRAFAFLSSLRKTYRSLFRRSRPFRLTGPGWVFILYTTGVGAGAINTGNNLLYLVFGIFLGLILASGVLSDLSLWGLAADVEGPRSGHAGDPALFFIRLENRKRWLPSFSVHVDIAAELNGEALQWKSYVPYVAARAVLTTAVTVIPPRRGYLRLTRVVFRTRYPFGLLQKWWTWRGSEAGFSHPPMEVYPALLKTERELPKPGLGNDQETHSSEERGEGTVVVGLREYREGDNPRRIHWKGSAKRPRSSAFSPVWLMREMEREQRPSVALVMPVETRLSLLPTDRKEMFVSFSATLLRRFEDRGYDVRIQLPSRQSETTVRWVDFGDAQNNWHFLAFWSTVDQAEAEQLILKEEFFREVSLEVDLWTEFEKWKNT